MNQLVLLQIVFDPEALVADLTLVRTLFQGRMADAVVLQKRFIGKLPTAVFAAHGQFRVHAIVVQPEIPGIPEQFVADFTSFWVFDVNQHVLLQRYSLVEVLATMVALVVGSWCEYFLGLLVMSLRLNLIEIGRPEVWGVSDVELLFLLELLDWIC